MSCLVPGCSTKPWKKTKISTFKVPSDEVVREKWAALIPGITSIIRPRDRVCALHFEDHLIIREYVAYAITMERSLHR